MKTAASAGPSSFPKSVSKLCSRSHSQGREEKLQFIFFEISTALAPVDMLTHGACVHCIRWVTVEDGRWNQGLERHCPFCWHPRAGNVPAWCPLAMETVH